MGRSAGAVVTSDTELRGRALTLARVGVAALAVLSVTVMVADLPHAFRGLQVVCPDGACPHPHLSPAALAQLQDLGRTPVYFASYFVLLNLFFAAAHWVLAGLLLLRRSDDALSLLTAAFLIVWGAAFPSEFDGLAASGTPWFLAVLAVRLAQVTLVALLLALFPQGRFAPPWMLWLTCAWVPLQLSDTVPFDALLAPYWPPWLQGPGAQIPAAVMVFMFFYRYRRLLTPLQRQQARMLMFGVLAALMLLTVFSLLNPFWTPGLTAEITANTLLYLVLLVIPTAVTVAVLRHGLWDLDRVIRRTVVYGLLSAGLIGLYMLIVGFLGALFQARGNLMIALAGTAAVAVAFQPLRQWLQVRIDRLVYGDRGDPYAVLSRLGRRLGAALAPEEALAAVVTSVREAFNLPYAAIVLRQGAADEIAAEAGTPDADPVEIPLYDRGEPVGRLVLGRRSSGTDFGQSDRSLLEDLARQAGAAAQSVRLTRELQRHRRQLVTAREDERRRLRRDLHDGLAPMLAAQSFRAATARRLLRDAPERAEEVLSELEADVERTLSDLRRLVYNLRPPALDQYGLVEAIRQYAANLGGGPRDELRAPRMIIEAPEPFPALDAATEAAAFRIVQEALANAVRHAAARTARVRIRVNGALEVEVCDDGNGLPSDLQPGVGLSSMRERAEELGGTFAVSDGPEGGVRVVAELPLQPPMQTVSDQGGDADDVHSRADRR